MRIGLRTGTDTGRSYLFEGDTSQPDDGLAGVRDGATREIGRCAGDCEKAS